MDKHRSEAVASPYLVLASSGRVLRSLDGDVSSFLDAAPRPPHAARGFHVIR